jgi:hypothetical protein
VSFVLDDASLVFDILIFPKYGNNTISSSWYEDIAAGAAILLCGISCASCKQPEEA